MIYVIGVFAFFSRLFSSNRMAIWSTPIQYFRMSSEQFPEPEKVPDKVHEEVFWKVALRRF